MKVKKYFKEWVKSINKQNNFDYFGFDNREELVKYIEQSGIKIDKEINDTIDVISFPIDIASIEMFSEGCSSTLYK